MTQYNDIKEAQKIINTITTDFDEKVVRTHKVGLLPMSGYLDTINKKLKEVNAILKKIEDAKPVEVEFEFEESINA